MDKINVWYYKILASGFWFFTGWMIMFGKWWQILLAFLIAFWFSAMGYAIDKEEVDKKNIVKK